MGLILPEETGFDGGVAGKFGRDGGRETLTGNTVIGCCVGLIDLEK